MQQINLYQEMFHPQRRSLAMPLLAGGFVVMLALMIVMSWWQQGQLEQATQRYHSEQQRQEALLAELDSLQQKLATLHPSAQLVQQLLATRQQLEQQKPLLQQLAQLSLEQDQVTDSLEALARRPLDNLWFTRVQLTNGGRSLQLNGKAVDADRLPGLVDRLGQETVFSQRQFSFMRLQRQEDGLYDFTLNTEGGGGDE